MLSIIKKSYVKTVKNERKNSSISIEASSRVKLLDSYSHNNLLNSSEILLNKNKTKDLNYDNTLKNYVYTNLL